MVGYYHVVNRGVEQRIVYNEMGYSQQAIAECLGFSQLYINKIVKRIRDE